MRLFLKVILPALIGIIGLTWTSIQMYDYFTKEDQAIEVKVTIKDTQAIKDRNEKRTKDQIKINKTLADIYRDEYNKVAQENGISPLPDIAPPKIRIITDKPTSDQIEEAKQRARQDALSKVN
jgi:hypothetical protein